MSLAIEKNKGLFIHPRTPRVSVDTVQLRLPKIFPSVQLTTTFIAISELSLKILL